MSVFLSQDYFLSICSFFLYFNEINTVMLCIPAVVDVSQCYMVRMSWYKIKALVGSW